MRLFIFWLIVPLAIGSLAGCSDTEATARNAAAHARPISGEGASEPPPKDLKVTVPMSKSVCYIANGYSRNATEQDRRYGRGELRIFNPTQFDTSVYVKVYFENKPPVDLPAHELDAHSNKLLLVIPKKFPEIFNDVGAWGARIVSDVPVIVDHILGGGIASPQPNDTRFRGGVSDQLAQTRTSSVWYFGDGFRLHYAEPDKAPYPFNEIEWYHILNPNKRDADVTMHCLYGEDRVDVFTFRVNAERVKLISNEDIVRPNIPYGIKFTSNEPVVIQSERLIYGLHSKDEWGMHMHTARPGLPGPLEFSEETQ